MPLDENGLLGELGKFGWCNGMSWWAFCGRIGSWLMGVGYVGIVWDFCWVLCGCVTASKCKVVDVECNWIEILIVKFEEVLIRLLISSRIQVFHFVVSYLELSAFFVALLHCCLSSLCCQTRTILLFSRQSCCCIFLGAILILQAKSLLLRTRRALMSLFQFVRARHVHFKKSLDWLVDASY